MFCFLENLVTQGSVLQNIFYIGLIELLCLILVGRCELASFQFELCKLQTSSFVQEFVILLLRTIP